MPSKISRLISHYEAEQTRLLALIAECTEEHEYALAHRNSKALRTVNQKLQTYYGLADPWHTEKETCLRKMEGLNRLLQAEKDAEKETSLYFRRYCAEQILHEQQKLEELNQRTTTANQPPASTLQEALEKLLNQHIDQFTLMIDDVLGLYCICRRARRTLFITFPQVRRLRAKYALSKKSLKYLQLLGFRFYDQKDKLILFLEFAAPADIGVVKRTLAQIVFEVFYYKQFEGKAYVKYVARPDPPLDTLQ